MSAPAFLLISALSASGFHAAAGVDTEAAAGIAPAVIGEKAEPVRALLVTPLAGLKWASKHQSMSVSYAPRFFWRRPDLGTLQIQAPEVPGEEPETSSDVRSDALLLHQAEFRHAAEIARYWNMSTNAQMSLGEVNYTAAQDLIAGNRAQSRVVRSLVVDLYRYEGQLNLDYAASLQSQWTLSLTGESTGPRDADTATVGEVLQSSSSAGGQLSWSYRATPTDQFDVSGLVAIQRLEGTGDYFLAQPELSYTRRFSAASALALTAGAVVLSRVGLPSSTANDLELGGAERPAVNATGGVRFNSKLYGKSGVQVAADMGGGVDWFLDPILGQFFPTLSADIGFDIDVGRNWQVDPSISFFSVLDRQLSDREAAALGPSFPLTNYDPADPSDSTRLGWQVPLRYRLTRGVFLNGGTRASMRTRRLTSPRFNWTEQVEFWAYLGLSVQLSTEREGTEDWLYRPEDKAAGAQQN